MPERSPVRGPFQFKINVFRPRARDGQPGPPSCVYVKVLKVFLALFSFWLLSFASQVLTGRSLAYEADQEHERKKQKLVGAENFLHEREAKLEESLAQMEVKLKAWQDVLTYVTALETHGSKKPAHVSWQRYFQQALQDPTILDDCPACYKNSEESFQAVVVSLSNHIGTLGADLSAQKQSLQRTKTAASKRKKAQQCLEERAEKKMRKALKTAEEKDAEKFLG